MKPLELFKIIVAVSLPILFGTPLLFKGVESLQSLSAGLTFPRFAPSRWFFPLVWVYMYAGMGIGMFFIWDMQKSKRRNDALKIFAVQFLLNIAFNYYFFYRKETFIAIIILLVMWFAILIMTIAFYRLKRFASYLILPYFAWRTFSIPLLFSIWNLNS